MTNSLKTVKEALALLSNRPLCLALSGGMDSIVLLHLLVSQKLANNLRAVHVHHGLSPNADRWEAFCRSACDQWQVKLEVHRVSVDLQVASLEEAARRARYQVFDQVLRENEVLLQAHHATDQAETLIFRLLRGTGIKGLGGIPATRALGKGQLQRPLLGCTRAELASYAQSHELTWVEDESNQDLRFSRNRIRHQIMPVLRDYQSNVDHKLSQTAERLALDYQMLDRLAQGHLKSFLYSDGSLQLIPLVHEGVHERAFWIQTYLDRYCISLTQKQLKETVKALFSGEDTQPEFRHPQYRLRRYDQRLYLLPHEKAVWTGLLEAGMWQERAFDRIKVFGAGDWELKGRPEGCQLQMPSGSHRKLKKWLQDQNIAPWWREHLPYVYRNGQLVAIASLWRSPDLPEECQVEWQVKEELPWP